MVVRRTQVILLFISIATVALSGYFFWAGLSPYFLKTKDENIQTEKVVLGEGKQWFGDRAFVVKAIDGDTIEVDFGGDVRKVRYIGIDTPETVDPRRPQGCFGQEASGENKRLIEGKEVILEKDVSDTDKFGRLLRYVYLKLNDGTDLFVNDYLVRSGFAKNSTFPPDIKYQERFLQAEKEAMENNRGLWGECKEGI